MRLNSRYGYLFGCLPRKRETLSGIFLCGIRKGYFHLQEYQSKTLLQKYGINIQPFVVLSEHEGAIAISAKIKELACKYPKDELVIKAQILAGGRGKGHFPQSGLKGGVKVTTR